MAYRRKKSWAKKRERVVYVGLIAAATLLAIGIKVTSQFAIDVRFLFLTFIILLMLGIIVLSAKRFK